MDAGDADAPAPAPSLQDALKAEGGALRVKRAMEHTDVQQGTLNWGPLLLSRLDRATGEELLESEMQQMVDELDAKYSATELHFSTLKSYKVRRRSLKVEKCTSCTRVVGATRERRQRAVCSNA